MIGQKCLINVMLDDVIISVKEKTLKLIISIFFNKLIITL